MELLLQQLQLYESMWSSADLKPLVFLIIAHTESDVSQLLRIRDSCFCLARCYFTNYHFCFLSIKSAFADVAEKFRSLSDQGKEVEMALINSLLMQ